MYDDQGNQYNFGRTTATLTLGADIDDYAYVKGTIPGNVFVNGKITIKNVDSSASELTNVTIWSDSHEAYLVFKNVKIRN